MNPQLTAAQERAREIIKEMFLANFCDGDSWDDASASCFTKHAALDIAEFFWNEAIRASEKKVPKKIGGGIGPAVVDISAEGMVRGHNSCRTETLQALATLKV